MKKFYENLKERAQKIRAYISPIFLALLAVSFTLWYISKLSHPYTTDFNIKVTIDDERIEVPCVVEGKGSTLFGYSFYASRRVSIPLSELKYKVVEVPASEVESADGKTPADDAAETPAKPQMVRKARITPESMLKALSVRFSDVKIVSMGAIDDISLPEK